MRIPRKILIGALRETADRLSEARFSMEENERKSTFRFLQFIRAILFHLDAK